MLPNVTHFTFVITEEYYYTLVQIVTDLQCYRCFIVTNLIII